MSAQSEPRFTTIADGVVAQVIERRAIPAHVTSASHEGRAAGCHCRPLVESMRITTRFPVKTVGIRLECRDRHAYEPWIRGWLGLRELELSRCPFCEAVEVRDISLDILPGVMAGRGGPRRRSDVLGWYSGTRPLGRVHI